MKKMVFFIVLSIVLLSSCDNKRFDYAKDDGDTVKFNYATLISVVKHSDYSVATIKDPWKGKTLHTYILVPRGKTVSNMPKGTVVETPIEHSVVFTTVHCKLLEYLDALNCISGVCDSKYIIMPKLHEKIKEDKVEDCGSSMSPNIEQIIEMKPQAILLSPFENSGGYGKLEKINIPVIECADYMETSALGRAEWMKFYGLLYGCEDKADSLFNVVEKNYSEWKAIASKMPKGRSVLTERMTSSVWYCPGGASTIGQLIADANGRYAFSEDKHNGSLPLSFEQIVDKAVDSDIWLIKYNAVNQLTCEALKAEYHGYDVLKAYRMGEIYTCNTSQIPYYEDTPFRPDYLLREFVLLLHPSYKQLGKLKYYSKIQI